MPTTQRGVQQFKYQCCPLATFPWFSFWEGSPTTNVCTEMFHFHLFPLPPPWHIYFNGNLLLSLWVHEGLDLSKRICIIKSSCRLFSFLVLHKWGLDDKVPLPFCIPKCLYYLKAWLINWNFNYYNWKPMDFPESVCRKGVKSSFLLKAF